MKGQGTPFATGEDGVRSLAVATAILKLRNPDNAPRSGIEDDAEGKSFHSALAAILWK